MESILLEKEEHLTKISTSLSSITKTKKKICTTNEQKEEKTEVTKIKSELNWKEWERLARDEGLALQIHEIIEEKITKGELATDDIEYIQNKEFIEKMAIGAKTAQKAYSELISHKGWTTQVDNHKVISKKKKRERNTVTTIH
ncbi:hypothetical protein RFI_15515 [Reticulomyxa filosa]|uniref:Uncharacterized protein n=1 Tax=Reticulomyxa filosa TaxID=46433 RepID=X6N6Z0_RETFI|nr:hypothetical protein RFI_15515 [Reticulomyxa filosa]|eukprot:ETO21688.1 hypothetical protein RFI_15515 [Reticulomyxa filosa]